MIILEENKTNVEFWEKLWHFTPPYMEMVYDEYLLFDFLGLISSVGGTLGIFIGFSFIAIISSFLSYLLSMINRI